MASNQAPKPSDGVGSVPPTLPPSVEAAYRQKCIELKRRLNEVEESNNAARLRKVRLDRGIRKMRLERCILLDALSKRMKKNGVDGYDEYSEGSSEGPPTQADSISPTQPQEKLSRFKRSYRRPMLDGVSLAPQALQPSVLSFPNGPSQTPPPPSNRFPTPINGERNLYSHDLHGPQQPIRPPIPVDDFIDSQFQPGDPDTDELRERALSNWKALTDDEKRPWQQAYEQRMGEYQLDMNAHRALSRRKNANHSYNTLYEIGPDAINRSRSGEGLSGRESRASRVSGDRMSGMESAERWERMGPEETDAGEPESAGATGGFTAVNG